MDDSTSNSLSDSEVTNLDLSDFAGRLSTLDVALAALVGLGIWAVVNAVGMFLVARTGKQRLAEQQEEPDRKRAMIGQASVQAGIKLLASLLGLFSGIGTAILLAY